jgi:hypothetical protein
MTLVKAIGFQCVFRVYLITTLTLSVAVVLIELSMSLSVTDLEEIPECSDDGLEDLDTSLGLLLKA